MMATHAHQITVKMEFVFTMKLFAKTTILALQIFAPTSQENVNFLESIAMTTTDAL